MIQQHDGTASSPATSSRNQRIDKFWLHAFYIFSGVLLTCALLSIYTENYLLMLIPAGILFLYLSINDFRIIYFLLLFYYHSVQRLLCRVALPLTSLPNP